VELGLEVRASCLQSRHLPLEQHLQSIFALVLLEMES
jgi:hypothetical protein